MISGLSGPQTKALRAALTTCYDEPCRGPRPRHGPLGRPRARDAAQGLGGQ